MLDLKGLEKHLNQVSVQSYVGCSHCTAHFAKGFRGPRFTIARHYLPIGHHLRRRIVSDDIMYPDSCEEAGPPKLKDTVFVHAAARRAEMDGYEHYLGQKGYPMFANLINYSYEDMLVLDWMHGLVGLYKWSKKITVGPYGDKSGSRSQMRAVLELKERRQCKANDVFPELWPDAPVYLDDNSARILRNLDPEAIPYESSTWCKRWWKVCRKKVEPGTRVADLRGQILTWRNYLAADVTRKLIIDRGESSQCVPTHSHTHHTHKYTHKQTNTNTQVVCVSDMSV